MTGIQVNWYTGFLSDWYTDAFGVTGIQVDWYIYADIQVDWYTGIHETLSLCHKLNFVHILVIINSLCL